MRKILLLALALGLTLGTTGTALADGAKKAGTVTYDINLKTPDGAKTANVYLPYPIVPLAVRLTQRPSPRS